MENAIKKMGTLNWRKVAQDRDGWRRAAREVLIRLGQRNHRGRTRTRRRTRRK
jgi:hypothetical protein